MSASLRKQFVSSHFNYIASEIKIIKMSWNLFKYSDFKDFVDLCGNVFRTFCETSIHKICSYICFFDITKCKKKCSLIHLNDLNYRQVILQESWFYFCPKLMLKFSNIDLKVTTKRRIKIHLFYNTITRRWLNKHYYKPLNK